MASAAEIVRVVRDSLDGSIRSDFVRTGNSWIRTNGPIEQRIRLDRMANRLQMPWVTLSLRLETHTIAHPQRNIYLPPELPRRVQDTEHTAIDAWNFPFDAESHSITETLQSGVILRLPFWHDYLDAMFTADGFLLGYARSRPRPYLLAAMVDLDRRAEVQAVLNNMKWEPDPQPSSWNWYHDLETAEIVLDAYAYLGVTPSERWLAMIDHTLQAIRTPEKAHASRYERVGTLRSALPY